MDKPIERKGWQEVPLWIVGVAGDYYFGVDHDYSRDGGFTPCYRKHAGFQDTAVAMNYFFEWLATREPDLTNRLVLARALLADAEAGRVLTEGDVPEPWFWEDDEEI